MRFQGHFRALCTSLILLLSLVSVAASMPAPTRVTLSVVDETGVAVPEVQVTLQESGKSDIHLTTDFAGHAAFVLQGQAPYALQVQKSGFYRADVSAIDPTQNEVRVVLNHQQIVQEQVSVAASTPGIDTQQTADTLTMSLPEIINIPYQTSRDIRNILPYFPGIIQDESGQIHVAGSETWATLDTLDHFDIRSPVSGVLAMRVSADAVRSIDHESTRYPVEYGRATGGVIAFYTGMGDNKFRFNATDFIPSFKNVNGIQFDKFVPRVTFSGPFVRDRAWFFDGLELEYDNNYIRELPHGADTGHILRGSNLLKFQVNATPANIISLGLLNNVYHSPYEGLSPLNPQQSTTRRNTLAWLPYIRAQHSFHNGGLLDLGLDVVRFTDGYEPHGAASFNITPELSQGSYFESLSSHSQRVESNGIFYLPPMHRFGIHNFEAGIDADHINFDESVTRAPIHYLREDGTLLRESSFPPTAPFARHNEEFGAYVQDRWTPAKGLLLEPGLRFDYDEILRRFPFAPRLAGVYAPPRFNGNTKISAGIGLYYEHTQLEYLTRAFAGLRTDTYYAADGVTPADPPLSTSFTANYDHLDQARAVNWSVGVEQKLPGSTYLAVNLIRKHVTDEFIYVDTTSPSSLSGNFALTNGRDDHDNLFEIEARHSFSGNYALFAAYTHSTARTNAAIDYTPTLSMLGPQQSGPLPWDTPNRVLSWGWVPFLVPGFRKSWDFVYTVDWNTGFPFTAVNAADQVVGAAGAYRFPHELSLSPGLEWRFHFRGSYFGLRGILENVTDSHNPAVVNNVVDSPQFGTFSEFEGRAITARIRLIGSKN